MRRSLAIALLCCQVSAAAHLALVSHVTVDSGAVVDAKPLCSQGSHGSSGVAHGHQLQREETECEVVALVRTAAWSASATLVPVHVPAVVEPLAPHTASPVARDVLSVAPKASPPV